MRKVPFGMICTVPVKCTPMIEDDVVEDEIDMDGVSMLSPIPWKLSISKFGENKKFTLVDQSFGRFV